MRRTLTLKLQESYANRSADSCVIESIREIIISIMINDYDCRRYVRVINNYGYRVNGNYDRWIIRVITGQDELVNHETIAILIMIESVNY